MPEMHLKQPGFTYEKLKKKKRKKRKEKQQEIKSIFIKMN